MAEMESFHGTELVIRRSSTSPVWIKIAVVEEMIAALLEAVRQLGCGNPGGMIN